MPKYKRRKRKYVPRAKGANDRSVTVWSQHSVLEKANKALNLASKVYKFVNTEVKYFDVEQSGTAVPWTGNIVGLTAPPQGDGQSTRDGDSIKLMGLVMRLRVNLNFVTTTSQQVRVIIFRGKQENGVGFAISDILDTPAALHMYPCMPKPYDERFRTKILFDKTYNMNELVLGNSVSRLDTIKLKPGGHVNYSAGTTSIENGGLYMLTVSNTNISPPSIDFLSRITYVDN